jgi:hypothetical protein
MTGSLFRRLDDALSAFATGHSRRDLDRVRRRHVALHGLRRERGLVQYADLLDEHWREDGPPSGMGKWDRSRAKTAKRLARRLVQGFCRAYEAALREIVHVLPEGRSVRARDHMKNCADREFSDDLSDIFDRAVTGREIETAERNGHFYLGFYQKKAFDLRHDKLLGWR